MSRRTWAALALLAICPACRGAPDSGTRIREALHLPDRVPSPLRAEVDTTWRRRDAVVERVRFHGYHGEPIPALVSYSELARTRPLPVLLLMPGSPNRKEDLLQPRALLPLWAQAGFFVLTIDRPYHGERPGDPAEAIRDKGLPRVLGEYVFDLERALDYAEGRPEADSDRIGMMGLSMGGLEALLLAAVDQRVDCVVSVAGQLGRGLRQRRLAAPVLRSAADGAPDPGAGSGGAGWAGLLRLDARAGRTRCADSRGLTGSPPPVADNGGARPLHHPGRRAPNLPGRRAGLCRQRRRSPGAVDRAGCGPRVLEADGGPGPGLVPALALIPPRAHPDPSPGTRPPANLPICPATRCSTAASRRSRGARPRNRRRTRSKFAGSSLRGRNPMLAIASSR